MSPIIRNVLSHRLRQWVVFSFFSCSPLWAKADVTIKDIRAWRSPDKTRLVFDLSGKVTHDDFFLENPNRLVLDLVDSKKPRGVSLPKLKDTPVSSIRYGIRNKDDLRVVLDLKSKVTSDSFLLSPNAAYGYRLVVDLFDDEASHPKTVIARKQSNKVEDIIVAIDAGHGGEDSGALAYGGGYEKKVTLGIAKYLDTMLDNEPGFEGVMIRTGDYYIPLRGRSKKAREADADLFISIHADAFRSPKARGASVFALSNGGASSETARWLAYRENSTDQIGGEGGVSLNDKDDLLAEVLLDLSMTSTLSSSLEVGDMVLKSIGTINHLHKKKVEQAGFVVLKSPDIPSILVETGFISNPLEGRKLETRTHQKAMAKQIMNGVRRYFIENTPPNTLLAQMKAAGDLALSPDEYIVRAGDTLSEIAEEFDVSLNELRASNRLGKGSSIRIGQKLSIPN